MFTQEPLRHAATIEAAIRCGEAVNSALVASWQRSANLHRLDPCETRQPQRIDDGALAARRARVEPMLRVAQASLDRLHQAVGGMGCCVMIADRDGVPLERRGVAGDDATFEEWGLWNGSIWSEHSEGTNGIGTCLVEQRPLTIHRNQHFFTRNTLLSCTTAPIFDHEGQLAGAIDVSSCRNDLNEELINVVAMAVGDAARRIEAESFRLAYPTHRIVVAPMTDGLTNALVALDKDGVVVGATRAARQAYRQRGKLLGVPLPEMERGDGHDRFDDALRRAEKAILERALTRANGNVTEAARRLQLSRATLHRKLGKHGLERPQ